MNVEEANAALAANPAALVLAGRDVDAVIAFLDKRDPAVPASIEAFRKSLVGANRANQLILTTKALRTFGSVAAMQRQEVDTAAAYQEQLRADTVRFRLEYNRKQAFVERANRSTHPVFAALRARINATELAIVGASVPSDLENLTQDLRDAFASASASFAVAVHSIIGEQTK